MTWQIHDPANHNENEWQNVPGSFRDGESVVRAYLSDRDPRDYDPMSKFSLRVRRDPKDTGEKIEVSIQPLAWRVNGRAW